MGEGQISYAGPGAVVRAKLAADIVMERLKLVAAKYDEIQVGIIGINALHGEILSTASCEPYEVRIPVVARSSTLKDAVRVGNEVEALYTNGPAGGGGATKSAKEVIAMGSAFVPREEIHSELQFL